MNHREATPTTNCSGLIIIGAGGHALSVADAAISSGRRVVGFYAPTGKGVAASLGPIFPSLELVDLEQNALVPGIGANFRREEILENILSLFSNVIIESVVHASAWISPTAIIEIGSVVLARAFVGPNSSLGRGAVVNTGASLDHESSLGNFVTLGPGAYTGGRVRIGRRSMVGMQAGVLQGVTIGMDTVIGAHSLVRSDIGNNKIAWGVPAKVFRTRSSNDDYY